jgi:hypothetical protein
MNKKEKVILCTYTQYKPTSNVISIRLDKKHFAETNTQAYFADGKERKMFYSNGLTRGFFAKKRKKIDCEKKVSKVKLLDFGKIKEHLVGQGSIL